MNLIAISGYLTADPELRNTQDGTAVVSFRIGCRKKFSKGKDATDFFNVVAWRKNAEFVEKYFSKGKPVEIEGYLDARPWTDKNGSKHEGIRIVAERLNFSLGDKPKEQEQQAASVSDSAPNMPEGFDPFAQSEEDFQDLPF
ncbi:single-stranded DNA-binding protein [Anaerotruncus rubiinfantis]|uniref:single-stranded DNA-binding protein n=1 Tax=Anaerotruncus rubiinfantis TaxID=1720200 RepID=UPI003D79D416